MAGGRGVGLALVALLALTGCTSGPSAERSSPSRAISTSTAGATSSPGPAPEFAQTMPASAAAAVVQVVTAETALGDASTAPKDLAAAARSQQLAYRQISRHPGWDRVVLPGVPSALRWLVEKNLAARRAFISLGNSAPLASTVPAWRILDPLPASHLLGDFKGAGRRYGIDWTWLAAVMITESGSGRIHGLSTAGAQGPMQFLPSTFATYGQGGDIDDPDDAIPAAARFLVAHGGARPGGMAGALHSYNNSSAYVRGVTLLAQIMQRRPRAWTAYYHWEVYYRTTAGDVHLAVGYDEPKPIPVRHYLATHPDALVVDPTATGG